MCVGDDGERFVKDLIVEFVLVCDVCFDVFDEELCGGGGCFF